MRRQMQTESWVAIALLFSIAIAVTMLGCQMPLR